MVKGKTKGGVAIADRGNEALSTDVVKLLKSQDVGYIKTQIAQDEKKIAKLRTELEVTAPAGGKDEWGVASELAEVEKLAEMGVVVKPRQEVMAPRNSRKGKGRELPTDGHVVFVDEKAEFEAFGMDSSEPAAAEEEEEVVDLGWMEPEVKKKGKCKAAAPQEESDDEAEDDVSEARQYRLELLSRLSALLGRVRLLRQAESRLETQKSLMGKGGAARKVQEAGFVEDENASEDRNGDRKRWQAKQFKWKLERRK